MLSFKTYFENIEKKIDDTEIEFDPRSMKTQVATTGGTYAKASRLLNPKGKTLDYGAGLGLGTDVLNSHGLNADSYEPFPNRWKGKSSVTYSNTSSIPSDTYDNIVNFSVLNVVKPNVRIHIIKDIGRILKKGGTALVTARTQKDVDNAKNKTPDTEEGGYIVGDRYQKGFSTRELLSYTQSILGDDFEVSPNPHLNGASIKIFKKDHIQTHE